MKATLSLTFSSVLSVGSAIFIHALARSVLSAESFYGGTQGIVIGAFIGLGLVCSLAGGLLSCDKRSHFGWLCASGAYALAVLYAGWMVDTRLT
jgi:hypothetical protein